MKKTTTLATFLAGALSCLLYVEYTSAQQEVKTYGDRNVQAELKANVDRANLVLDTVETKYIKKNVPKPDPLPKPNLCSCNGTGFILQADGNKSQCQCASTPEGCKCKPKTEPQPGLQQ